MPNEQPVSIPRPSFIRAIILGALLIVVDAFYLNQGGIALLVGALLLLVGLPRTFLAKKYYTVRPQRLRNIAVYFVAVILVFTLNATNNRLARTRAEILVSAVKAFHARNQQYPKSLEELVPDYIAQVPAAKYTLTFNRFSYTTSNDSTRLSYIALPPFGRPYYSFDKNIWRYMD